MVPSGAYCPRETSVPYDKDRPPAARDPLSPSAAGSGGAWLPSGPVAIRSRSPPCASIRSRAIARPRPEPPVRRMLVNGRNRLYRTTSNCPGPSSAISIASVRARPDPHAHPEGPASAALLAASSPGRGTGGSRSASTCWSGETRLSSSNPAAMLYPLSMASATNVHTPISESCGGGEVLIPSRPQSSVSVHPGRSLSSTACASVSARRGEPPDRRVCPAGRPAAARVSGRRARRG